MFRTIIGFIGFLYLYSRLKSIILFFYNLVIGPARNLTAIYGKGSYVLITGGSEGIGEGLAKEFASRGFNLILIARSVEKLEKAKAQIKKSYPACNVVIVSFDFEQIDKPENFDLSKAFKLDFSKLDVSIVINNVGIGRNGLFYDSNEEEIKKMIKVNCVPQVLVSRYFISLFNKRKTRSAIINVSSQSAIHNLPLYDLYGASKRFNYHFSESLGNFYSNIDVYSFLPGFVTTRLTNFRTEGNTVATVEECAKGAINNIGSYRYIFYGHWKHEAMAFLLHLLPEKLLAFFIMKNKANYLKKRAE